VDGDRAVSEAYAIALIRPRADDSQQPVNMPYRGRYLDRWSLRDDRWEIDHRRLVKEIVWAEAVADGYMGEVSRRGPEDPVYALFGPGDEKNR
jgi:hypothetical protein